MKTTNFKETVCYQTIKCLMILLSSLMTLSTAKEPLPISLTVSGGVSMGSYQAGYHYVANDWVRTNNKYCKVYIVTGASAGAINALLSVLSLADTSFCRDTNSLFYRTWIPVSYNKLKGNTSALGVFNRSFFSTLADSIIKPALLDFVFKWQTT